MKVIYNKDDLQDVNHQASKPPHKLRRRFPKAKSLELEDSVYRFRTNPSVSVRLKTKSARGRLKTAHTNLGTNEESRTDETSKKIKLEDLLNLMHDTRYAFFSPESPVDELIIVSHESDEEETQIHEDTHASPKHKRT
ncbi:hypothetical protein Tco_0675781 [Tanacetum coccineum]